MPPSSPYSWRLTVFILFLLLLLMGLVGRLVDLTIFNREFLIKQSDARILRKVSIPAYRGMIVDRLGVPLAISTPVESIWANPKIVQLSTSQLDQLSQLLEMDPQKIQQEILLHKSHSFIYLKRHIPPPVADKILAMKITGIYAESEFQRYYPLAEIASQVIGFTNVDDQGQEGLELAYNQWLSGVPGNKEVIKDRLGNIVENVATLKLPQQGQILQLSLDHRLQYLAYHYLQKAMIEFQASAGSVVILDAHSGEILAMVNQPSFNPNNRSAEDSSYRNRAVTDMFEPGSTIKPFTIALALMSGKYKPEDTIDTNPGWMQIGGYSIRDDGFNYGVINLTQILEKSSNIGAAKIMLSLPPQAFWQLLRQAGFGQNLGTGFPGEAAGRLQEHQTWRPSVVATLAYGYGIATTAIQLAHAYSILANGGVSKPVLFLKTSANKQAHGIRILPADINQTVLSMLEDVVLVGTGKKAQVPGYRVAGKTGTAYIAGPAGYDRTRYTSSFVGIAPVSNPRLVIAVIIQDPHGQSFGALVAAPVFSRVMEAALRLLNIPPDNLAGNNLENTNGVVNNSVNNTQNSILRENK